MYNIKPLEWERTGNCLDAATPFGTYTIMVHDVGRTSWAYCYLNTMHREVHHNVSSEEEARKAAEQHWIETVEKCLVKV